MSSSYTGNPTNVLAPSSAPNLTTYPISTIPSDGDADSAASVSQALSNPLNFIAYFQDRFRDLIFGSGTDGSSSYVTSNNVSGTLQNTTITNTNTGITITTNGWAFLARNSITFNNCTISGNATSASATVNGGYSGTPVGPHCSPVLNTNTLSTYTTYYLPGLGGNGGAGGGGGLQVSVVSPSGAQKQYPYRYASVGTLGATNATTGAVATPGYAPIVGGTAGSCSSGSGSSAGGSGAGGCLVVLIAPSITLTNVTFTSNGGGGGNVTGGVGAVGGSGGGGGAFLFVCQTLTQSGCTYSASGGAAGTGTSNGNAGAAGVTTPYIVYVP